MQVARKFDTMNMQDDWLLCPVCGKKLLRLIPTTAAHDLPVYCKRCSTETIVNIDLCACAPEPEPT